MTNLDSILKSKDITLPTKVQIVKGMVFPVVMYGPELDHKEGWALKNWCFELWCWRRLLRVPWTAKKSSQSVQSLSHVRLFVTPWTAAHQASLSITNSQSLLKLMSIESVMAYNHLILCRPLYFLPSIFPSITSNESLFASGGHNIGASASASVLPMNIRDWFPLGLTGLISLQSKGLSRVLSNTTVQKHQFFGAQLSI